MQTQNQTAQSGATLVVLEGKRLRIYDLDTKTDWSLGRDSMSGSVQPDIPFESTLISLEHSWVRLIGGKWYYVENPDNSNGTLYNGAPIARPRPGHKTGVLLQNGDILRIENVNPLYANSQSVMMLYSAVPITGKWKTLDLTGTAVTIGRDPNCTIVESLPYIATKHAAITYQHGGYYLSDCGGPSGTFLNGKRITGAVLLHEKDCIGLVDRKYFFLGNRLLYVQRNYQKEQKVLNSTPTAQHPIILSADVKSKVVNISKVPMMKKEKELLRDIRLDIREGSLVAVLGTAGAGKSTLMGCLSGLDQSRCYRFCGLPWCGSDQEFGSNQVSDRQCASGKGDSSRADARKGIHGVRRASPVRRCYQGRAGETCKRYSGATEHDKGQGYAEQPP